MQLQTKNKLMPFMKPGEWGKKKHFRSYHFFCCCQCRLFQSQFFELQIESINVRSLLCSSELVRLPFLFEFFIDSSSTFFSFHPPPFFSPFIFASSLPFFGAIKDAHSAPPPPPHPRLHPILVVTPKNEMKLFPFFFFLLEDPTPKRRR